jgi:hypothetical protein
MDPMTMDPMDRLTDLSNQLRLGRITVQEFRVRLVKALVGMTGDELLSIALLIRTIGITTSSKSSEERIANNPPWGGLQNFQGEGAPSRRAGFVC